MAPTLDAQTTESKARALLDNRINSVRALVTARQALDDLRAQIADAETADVKAYRAALSDGWSPDELRKLGLDEPEKKQRTRRRANAPKTTPTATTMTDQTAVDGEPITP